MRCLVVGTSGAGKSTFARALAHVAGCPHVELDDLYWGPDWTAVPPDAFAHAVGAATMGAHWVADGNYSAARDVLWPRATHVVWLNYGRWTVFSRLLWRTLGRGLSRRPLGHGNRESLRMAFFSPDSILLWSVKTFSKNRLKYAQLRNDPAYAHLQWTEVTEPSQARDFIARHAQANAQPTA